MGNHIEFQLASIDRKATKEKVEEKLEQYRLMLLTEELEYLPKVTQNFSLVPSGHTNQFHSTTEDAAIRNAEYLKVRRDFLRKIQNAVNRLSYKERAIIIKKYMSIEHVFDYEVYGELHMAERTYHRYKSSAFYNLAFALKLTVYEEQEVTGA